MTCPVTPPFVLFDTGPIEGGTIFADPVELIRAETAAEVGPAFDKMRRAQAAGKWLAGVARYELGMVLQPKLEQLLSQAGPLLEFGVFDIPLSGAARLAEADAAAGQARLSSPVALWDADTYGRAFDRVQAYISAGDIYQANLTMPLTAVAEGPALALYGALRQRQPVPHGAYLDLGGERLLSRSPKLFFRIRGDRIETRPMKGTHPRGATLEEDAQGKSWLATDPKNRAENLMIVDLLRNDISQVAEVGSVQVPELFAVESYATVHQMTSLVQGHLKDGIEIQDVFTALFPCGSITGAPKLRAMQIIHELETGPRGAYCGSIGWIAPNGDMEFNVAIRTLILNQSGDVRLNVGGGVVHDSTAASEYEEALLKSRFARLSGYSAA